MSCMLQTKVWTTECFDDKFNKQRLPELVASHLQVLLALVILSSLNAGADLTPDVPVAFIDTLLLQFPNRAIRGWDLCSYKSLMGLQQVTENNQVREGAVL